MILCIVKNGELYARSDGDGAASDYTLQTFDTAPDYPERSAGIGKCWDLQIVDGSLEWAAVDRPLTTEEKLEKVAAEVAELKNGWKAGEAVKVGDVRYYNGVAYKCLQAHTTQSDWTPDRVPALWQTMSEV